MVQLFTGYWTNFLDFRHCNCREPSLPHSFPMAFHHFSHLTKPFPPPHLPMHCATCPRHHLEGCLIRDSHLAAWWRHGSHMAAELFSSSLVISPQGHLADCMASRGHLAANSLPHLVDLTIAMAIFGMQERALVLLGDSNA